jgi:hypothetical protein
VEDGFGETLLVSSIERKGQQSNLSMVMEFGIFMGNNTEPTAQRSITGITKFGIFTVNTTELKAPQFFIKTGIRSGFNLEKNTEPTALPTSEQMEIRNGGYMERYIVQMDRHSKALTVQDLNGGGEG